MADSCLARDTFAMQPIDTFAVRACVGEGPFLQLLAHRALNPPPSSSLAEEERLRSLLLRAAARDSRRPQLSLGC
jgi:hypothetical protein